LLGGMMEYNSMYFGFAFLYLLAVYALAWIFSRKSISFIRTGSTASATFLMSHHADQTLAIEDIRAPSGQNGFVEC
jgi:hypothetical protein